MNGKKILKKFFLLIFIRKSEKIISAIQPLISFSAITKNVSLRKRKTVFNYFYKKKSVY